MNIPTVLIVNFGGPRDREEITPFLEELLTDPDVIRTPFPNFLARPFFRRVARKRAKQVVHDYQLIGGRSPIYEDTEAIASEIQKKLQIPVLTFHRYLPATHPFFLENIQKLSNQKLLVFPLFPQFSYATTGSIARWFSSYFRKEQISSLQWIRSYSEHPAYVIPFQKTIQDALNFENWKEDEVVLLFSSHGLPQAFVDGGDPYEKECNLSFQAISAAFPRAFCLLSYQSKFGRGEWLRPYTNDVCANISQWIGNRKKVLVIPLSFTSDHVETLFEIEYQYLPLIRKQEIEAKRCPALNRRADWIEGIAEILKTEKRDFNQRLIRPLSK